MEKNKKNIQTSGYSYEKEIRIFIMRQGDHKKGKKNSWLRVYITWDMMQKKKDSSNPLILEKKSVEDDGFNNNYKNKKINIISKE